MFMLFLRGPLPDATHWPGRRLLAVADAVGWPALALLALSYAPPSAALFKIVIGAGLVVAAFVRARRAVVANHRYHFTTARLVAAAAWLLLIGFAMKAASLFV